MKYFKPQLEDMYKRLDWAAWLLSGCLQTNLGMSGHGDISGNVWTLDSGHVWKYLQISGRTFTCLDTSGLDISWHIWTCTTDWTELLQNCCNHLWSLQTIVYTVYTQSQKKLFPNTSSMFKCTLQIYKSVVDPDIIGNHFLSCFYHSIYIWLTWLWIFSVAKCFPAERTQYMSIIYDGHF